MPHKYAYMLRVCAPLLRCPAFPNLPIRAVIWTVCTFRKSIASSDLDHIASNPADWIWKYSSKRWWYLKHVCSDVDCGKNMFATCSNYTCGIGGTLRALPPATPHLPGTLILFSPENQSPVSCLLIATAFANYRYDQHCYIHDNHLTPGQF